MLNIPCVREKRRKVEIFMGAMIEEVCELICWKDGEEDRPHKVSRACTCRTCQRSTPEGAVGILSGSNGKGVGFSIWIFNEKSYKHLRKIFGGEK